MKQMHLRMMIQNLNNFNMHPNNTTTTIPSNNDPVQMSIFVWSIVIMALLAGLCLFCICYVLCASEDRFFTFRQQEQLDDDDDDDEEGSAGGPRAERRRIILSNIIHKRVEKREENDLISLPHEKVIASRKKNKSCFIHQSSIGRHDNNNIHSNNPQLMNSTTNHRDNVEEAIHKHNDKDALNNHSMRSIREAMNIKSDSSIVSIYSPTICPICMESYHTDDEIAWSKNEDCYHAFHLSCIMKWLMMENSDCPMCRSKYI